MTTSSRPRSPRLSLLTVARRAVLEALPKLEKGLAVYERDGGSGDGLHDVRVSLRRTAAVGALAHGFPSRKDGRDVEEMADDLRRRLSGARQREVSIELMGRIGGAGLLHKEAPVDPAELRAETARLRDALSGWHKAMTRWRPAPADKARLGKRVERRLRKARRRVLTLGVPTRRTLHRQRVAGKALRYGVELASPLLRSSSELISGAKDFQDALGEAHDWEALIDELDALPKAQTRLLVPKVKKERRRALKKARKAAREFLELLERTTLAL